MECAAGNPGGNSDPPLLRELGGVVEQQEQDLVDLGEVGPDLRQRLLELFLDRDRVAPDRVLHAEDRLLHHFAKVHVGEFHSHLALLDPPQIEDVLERAQERRSVVQCVAKRLLGALGQHVVLAGQHGDDRLDDAIERCAQLARHLLDEVALELLDLTEAFLAA